MTAGFQTQILDFLRAEGLNVIETNGWRTRGRPGNPLFDPHGSVNHHTANGSAGNVPSLGICLDGRSDLAGPLCNVLQARNDDVYLIAAGRANHAGPGGWHGLSGNSSVWGLEIEHSGTAAEPFPADRYQTAVRVHTAFAKCSAFSADLVAQHYEWSTEGKIDFFRGEMDPSIFRSDIAQRLHPAPNPVPSPQEDEVSIVMEVPWMNGFPRPSLKVGKGPVDGSSFAVISYNGAPLDRVPVLRKQLDGTLAWVDGGPFTPNQTDAKGRVVDVVAYGLWVRQVYESVGNGDAILPVEPDGTAGDDSETYTALAVQTNIGAQYVIARK